MTNKEAIKILDNLKPGDYSNPYEKGEAIVMAISALQAQEAKAQLSAEGTTNLQPTCNNLEADTISRQAAISELMEWVEKEKNKSWSPFKGLFHWTGIKAMLECLPSAQPDSNESSLTQKALDTISRQAAIEAIEHAKTARSQDGEIYVAKINAEMNIQTLPSVQPEPSEITDEQAILHLQSTGWMQNHDREMYESGLREQLADDSGSYDSLIPYEDTISRQAAIDLCDWYDNPSMHDDLEKLPTAQPEPHWIPVSERLPEDGTDCLVSVSRCSKKVVAVDTATYSTDLFNVDKEDFFGNRGESGWYYFSGEYGYCKVLNVIAWMPLPEPYREERRTDGKN